MDIQEKQILRLENQGLSYTGENYWKKSLGGQEVGCHQIPPQSEAFLYFISFLFFSSYKASITCCTTLSMIKKNIQFLYMISSKVCTNQ